MKLLFTNLLILITAVFGLNTLNTNPIWAAAPIWAPPALAQIVEEGLVQNKEIQSLQAQVKRLEEEVSFAGSLDDPRLGIAALNVPTDTFSFDQEPMTQKQIFMAQKVPWFGKLGLRSQRTALSASRQKWILEARRLELSRQIANTYYELGFNSSALGTNDRLSKLVSQLLQVAETKYATGRGLQQDVLQAQVELSTLLDERIVLERQRRTLEDRINGLLNRERFTPVTPTGKLPYPDLRLAVAALQAQTLNQNPQLGVRQAEVDRAAVEIELAKKEYWPDMDFKVAYGQRGEDFTGRDLPDFLSAGVTVNIPLWQKSRQSKKLSAAKKSHEAAVKSYRNLAAVLPHQVDSLVTEIRNTQNNYRLYTDALVLQTEHWARSSLAAYEVGAVEFNTMINAQIRLLRFELQADRYLFSIYQKRAELEEVIGGPSHP
jgi:outer membrane protein TolC